MGMNVNHWVEAMSALPEKQFFNIMRLYLGEIKTPYNKQNLISQLASFIKTPENLSNLLMLLDKKDISVLTAIFLIPKPSQQTILEFFSGTYLITEIYSELINLSERLIVYSVKDAYSEKEFYYINPLILESLKPYLNPAFIFPQTSINTYSLDDVFVITPNFLISFISYIKIHKISCKADGGIKKNDLNRLEAIFPGRLNCIQLLMNAFINLNLVREGEKSFDIENNRLKAFSNLTEEQQYSLLCAASVSRFSRDGLKKEAQILLDTIASIPSTGYTKDVIIRLAFLAGTHTEDGSAIAKKSRFSQMLEASKSDTIDESLQNAGLLERMVDSAKEFGLIQFAGRNTEGEEIFIPGNFIGNQISESSKNQQNQQPQQPKVLNIDSTYTVTLMPGLTLSALLPLSSFLIVKKCGIVTELEITRQSASVSFDSGWTPESIFQEIEKYTYYELPQNLKINIQEWYASYSSAMLYHGYVLKVTDTNISLAENNPNIKKYIKEKLAEGIYLLSIPASSDIKFFISESGLEFLGNVKSSESFSESILFPMIRKAQPITIALSQNQNSKPLSEDSSGAILGKLHKVLESKDFDKNQKESLSSRISNRLILSESQLCAAAIRSEVLEADGMDFAGKVHLIESSIKEQDMIEITFPDTKGSGKFFTIIGIPQLISRQEGEAIARFQIEPNKEIENFLVSRITHLRRLRF